MARAEIPAELETGEQVELTPERVAHGGALVARLNNRVIFVRHGVLGEPATAKITGRDPRGRFFFADVVSVTEPSENRRPHPWAAADSLTREPSVGGMEYGHLTPETQRDYKRQVVIEQLTRLGGLSRTHRLLQQLTVEPLTTDSDLNWRTRIHYAVDPSSHRAAMFPHGSTTPVPVSTFPLADRRLAELRLEQLNLDRINRLDAAVSATDMVTLVFTVTAGMTPAEVAPALETEARKAWGSLEDRLITLIFTAEKRGGRRRGTKPADIVCGAGQRQLLETATVYAQDFYWEVDPTGFWQVHRAAPEVLGNAVLKAARIGRGQTVYDLYSGAGFFTALAADAVGPRGRVLAVEGSAVTSANAAHNFSDTGVSRTHRSERTAVRVEKGDVGRVLGRMGREVADGRYPRPDLVILDPSREGCGRSVLGQVSELAPQTLVYVACDPAALGRDTGYLRNLGWRPVHLEAYDMFPNTHHVETLAVFRR